MKGGYANSELKFSNTLNATGAVLGQSSTRVDGFVVGTGLEYGFAELERGGRVQLLSFDVGRQQQALGGVAVAAYNDAIDFNIHQVLVKLNYRFGG